MKTGRLIIAVLALFPVFATAMVFDGTWSKGLVFQKDRLDTARPMLGYIENLVLSVRKIHQTDLSFFTDLDYSHGYAYPGKPAFEMNSAYLDWAPAEKALTVRAGRQRNNDGNTSVSLDGVKVQGVFANRLILTGFGGRPLDSRYNTESIITRVDTTDFDYTLRADYLISSMRAGVIYQQRLTVSGGRDGKNVGLFLADDITEKWYARGNVVFDIVASTVRTFQVTTSYQYSEKLLLNGEASQEEWKIDSSSLFEKKIYHTYQQGSVQADYSIDGVRSVSLGYQLRYYNDQDFGHQISGRFSWQPVSLALRQDIGYGGAITMADILASRRFTRFLRGTVSGGVVRFADPDKKTLDNLGYSSALSADLGPESSPWDVSLETRYLRNPFYDYDVRAYISTVYRFSKFMTR